ncbi:hypothetical protein MMC30_008849 [Trapelia coarctata]|nr:hypothetical protein [Trapelia coarctata]
MAEDRPNPARLDIAHHVMYGQPGSLPTERVKGTDWKNIKPFKNPVSAPWNVAIPPGELPKILNGFRPREMEDKWIVYTDGPDAEGRAVVHFHRSWTGYKFVELEIEVDREAGVSGGEVEGSARIVKIVFEPHEDLDGRTEEAKRTAREVCRWVLNVELPDEGTQQERPVAIAPALPSHVKRHGMPEGFGPQAGSVEHG